MFLQNHGMLFLGVQQSNAWRMPKLSVKKFFRVNKSTSPCLLPIPAFGRIAGFYITDTLTLTGENAYATDFKVRLRAFADLAED